jgi:hypothetical protein
MPSPIGMHGRSLVSKPALVVAEILFCRAEDLARPGHRLFDNGNSLFERNGFGAILLILRRPYALLTHWAGHPLTLR